MYCLVIKAKCPAMCNAAECAKVPYEECAARREEVARGNA